MSKNSKTKENQNWTSEKPKLDNATRLRRSYFIDPEIPNSRNSLDMHGKKSEVPTVPAVPCKRTDSRHGISRSKNDDPKSKITCINGSRGIQKTTYGRNSTENSRRSHCRKKK